MSCLRTLPATAVAILLAAALSFGQARAQTTAATTNSSVTIATGNTYQQIVAAVGLPPATRRSITIQNNNTSSDNCWIQFGVGVTAANATKGASILLTPGGSFQRYFPWVPSDAIFGTCATTADTLYVDTQ